jgi:hypothetical protein
MQSSLVFMDYIERGLNFDTVIGAFIPLFMIGLPSFMELLKEYREKKKNVESNIYY